jgi:exodeoxyribonuclease V gamma subunit
MSYLRLHRGARVEALADTLAANLRAATPADPLAPMQVVVGSRGMERWLRHHLASQLGICANVAFPFPQQALNQVLGGPLDVDVAWTPDGMAWRLLGLLPTHLHLPELAPLREWLERRQQPSVTAVSPRLWALAREVADVLDRAALYRPTWLAQWRAGLDAGAPRWQGVLWRALEASAATPHPNARLEGTALPGPNEQPLPVVHIFGVSAMPPLWVAAWVRVAATRDVHVYHLTPSDTYWGEQLSARQLRRIDASAAERLRRDQHPLLTSLGQQARDAIEVWLSHDAVAQCEPSEDAFELRLPSGGGAVDHVLGWLQADVLAARSEEAIAELRPQRVLRADDDSVQFHDCHGPTRQVEVLREALLDLLDRHPALEPRDIVVMTPDIATYAPLVRTIFGEGYPRRQRDGWGPVGGPRLETAIADLGLRELNPLADVVLRLLALVEGRLTVSALREFAALDVVRRRFGWSEADVARLHTWLTAAGARWGLDADDRALAGQPPQQTYTIGFALDRMALGVTAADDDDENLFAGVAPFDDLEGDDALLFGALAEWVARLQRWRTHFRTPRPMSRWLDDLASAVDDLAAVSPKAGFLRLELNDGLAELRREVGDFADDVGVEVLSVLLESRFQRTRSDGRLATGAVTVCALAPMRSVPFKVVCLLGMDDGQFPRSPKTRAFDAVAQTRQPGDRDPRDEDRHLLLEALLAARSHLLVCYTGRNPSTGKGLPPAVPIGELLDVVDRTVAPPLDLPKALPRHWLVRRHPVQPFVASGFRSPEPWPKPIPARRFDHRMFDTALELAQSRSAPAAQLAPDEVLCERPTALDWSLEELADWLRKPVRQLVKKRLGLYLDDEQAAHIDREAISANYLTNFQLGSRLVAHRLRGQADREKSLACLLARVVVPPGAPGRAQVANLWLATDTAWRAWTQIRTSLGLPDDGPRRRQTVRLDFADERGARTLTGSAWTLGGALVDVGHDTPLRVRRLLPMWLRLLALTAAGTSVREGYLIGAKVAKDGGLSQDVVRLEAPDPAQASAILRDLLDIATSARAQPLRLVERTSFDWACKRFSGPDGAAVDDPQAALDAAGGAWHGRKGPGEVSDPTLAWVFAHEAPYGDGQRCHPNFEDLATRVWQPLLAARRPA